MQARLTSGHGAADLSQLAVPIHVDGNDQQAPRGNEAHMPQGGGQGRLDSAYVLLLLLLLGARGCTPAGQGARAQRVKVHHMVACCVANYSQRV